MMRRTAAAFAVLAALCCAPALASQGNLYSPTTGTVSGVALTENYNSALAALASCNAGAAAPANTLPGSPYAGQCWLNTATSPASLMVYSGSAWLLTGYVDAANGWWEPVIGGGAGTLAAATITDLGTQPYGFLSVTGTATIASLGTSAPVGSVKVIKFASGGSTLTYSPTAIVLPGSANITTAAGDSAVAVQTALGVWQVFYFPVGGYAAAVTGVPSGAVMAFNLTSCPTGWTLANGSSGTANMLGTVARGYDPSNTRDPNGSTQSIGSYESDMFQTHTMSAPAGGNFIVSGGTQIGITTSIFSVSTSSQGSTGGPNSGSYGPETRAKSTVLLYCQKN